MFNKEREIMRKIADNLSEDKMVLKIIAYGSRVRGDYRGDSDFDVLVVIEKKDKDVRDKILQVFYTHELEVDISFSITILSVEEFLFNEKLGSPFIASIKKEGELFYDSGYGREKGALK